MLTQSCSCTPVVARLFLLISLLPLPTLVGEEAGSASGSSLVFERQIRPIFKAHCFQCHGEGDKGKLDLRLRRLMVQGGESGPAIEPGKKDHSLLFERITQGEMPPGDKKLTPEEIKVIGEWIDAGAPTARPEPEEISQATGITPEDREFWFYQPVKGVPVPEYQPTDRVRTNIDAFLLKKLKEQGFGFSPEADKLTLIRRASFDLLGLPPTRDEIQTFLADQADDAYERMIDRLLSSPRYGERWGRHWLDVAGYADSNGYTSDDAVRPWAYKYRDYVIRAFNADKPFDQFLTEQLAGDELLHEKQANLTPQELETLVATGYLRMAADGTAGGVDQEVARNQVVADTLKIVSTSLLGLSVGCAQCHDHRYDPILQADYYRLRAIFEPALDWKAWRNPNERLISLYTDAERAKSAEISAEAHKLNLEREARQTELIKAAFQKELEKHPAELREALKAAYETPNDKKTPEQQKMLDERPSLKIDPGNLYQYDPAGAEELKKMAAKVEEVSAKRPPEEFIHVLTEPTGTTPVTYLFHRGDPKQPKDPVAPGTLTVCSESLSPIEFPADDPSLPSTGRRLAFAQWLTSAKNPLTARVLVNRFWLHHFGRGLVNTPSDFGIMGERPSHPELLDWLAQDFMVNGWKLKRLHKLIMTSTAYRQSSARPPELSAKDPENTLYGRFTVIRLDAEGLRDRVLSVTGVMNPAMFGPAITVQEDDVGQVIVTGETPAPAPGLIVPTTLPTFRRSVYVQQRRSQPVAMLQAFDAPVMQVNCEKRASSTVAPQALMLMNSDFVLKQSGYLATRVLREAGDQADAQIRTAWDLAYQRPPSDQELQQAQQFLNERLEYYKALPEAQPKPAHPQWEALTSLCQVLLSANEFLYID